MNSKLIKWIDFSIKFAQFLMVMAELAITVVIITELSIEPILVIYISLQILVCTILFHHIYYHFSQLPFEIALFIHFMNAFVLPISWLGRSAATYPYFLTNVCLHGIVFVIFVLYFWIWQPILLEDYFRSRVKIYQQIDFSSILTPIPEQLTENCSICLQSFGVGNEGVSLPCSHVFHSSCIKNWLFRQATCPVCRETVKN